MHISGNKIDNAYKTLGLKNPSTIGEIKKAYKRKAMELHPDIRKIEKETAENDFKDLNEAYLILLQSKKQPEIPIQHNTECNLSTKYRVEDNFNNFKKYNFDSYWSMIDHFMAEADTMFFGRKKINLGRSGRKKDSHKGRVKEYQEEDTCRTGHKSTTICLICKNL